MMKIVRAFVLSAVVAIVCSPLAMAAGSAYFTLPATFAEDVQATIVGVAGTILVILGLMFAWRKTVKSTNRS